MGWRAAQLPDQSGRVALVTGGNSGIGWHVARELAAHGARVVLACRNPDRGKWAVERIGASVPSADVEAAQLDLASVASVREFVHGWNGPLHVLVNNAGVMYPPRGARTHDGFELQFGTNHLGHFVLTGLLLPYLLEAPDARVVTVSTLAHRSASDPVADVHTARSSTYRADAYRADTYRAYADSKLANLLFAQQLHREAMRRALALSSVAAHPGFAATGLVADPQGLGANPVVRALAPAVLRLSMQPAAAGSRPVLYAATVAESGAYVGPQRLHETRGPVGPARMSAPAQDERLARRLWRLSEELTGFRYPWPASS
jgi:NAD(P)-dependent dehydrogenase (short-subunit alcohol dehydrogenase family)